jgi:hypothetical protein
VRKIAEKTEDFVLIFLLPIFFAYSGLKTEIGLLNSPELWGLCVVILGVAIVGKYVGTYYAARSCKIEKREASALGWLMNTRGLTELIVLNIGLELGVISPLLEWTYPKKSIRLTNSQLFDDEENTIQLNKNRSRAENEVEPISTLNNYRILVPVANPNTQKGLFQLAISIAHNDRESAIINPLSLIELEENYQFQSTPVEANRAIERQLERLNNLIDTLEPIEMRSIFQPIVQVGYDVAQKTAIIATLDRADLVLLGWHRPTFTNNRLGGRVAQMLANTPADVAVFIDVSPDPAIAGSHDTLFVPYTGNNHDDLAVEIALRMLWNDRHRQLELTQISLPTEKNNEFSIEINNLLANLPDDISSRIKISQINSIDPIATIEEFSCQVDLTITGIGKTWGRRKPALDSYTDRLATRCVSSSIVARRYSQFSSHLSFTSQDR